MSEIFIIPIVLVFVLFVGILLIVRRVSRREYHSGDHFEIGELFPKSAAPSDIDEVLGELRSRYEKTKRDQRLAEVFDELREIMDGGE